MSISYASNSHLSLSNVGIIIEFSLISITRNSLPIALNNEPLVSVIGILANISTRESLSSRVMIMVDGGRFGDFKR